MMRNPYISKTNCLKRFSYVKMRAEKMGSQRHPEKKGSSKLLKGEREIPAMRKSDDKERNHSINPGAMVGNGVTSSNASGVVGGKLNLSGRRVQFFKKKPHVRSNRAIVINKININNMQGKVAGSAIGGVLN